MRPALVSSLRRPTPTRPRMLHGRHARARPSQHRRTPATIFSATRAAARCGDPDGAYPAVGGFLAPEPDLDDALHCGTGRRLKPIIAGAVPFARGYARCRIATPRQHAASRSARYSPWNRAINSEAIATPGAAVGDRKHRRRCANRAGRPGRSAHNGCSEQSRHGRLVQSRAGARPAG